MRAPSLSGQNVKASTESIAVSGQFTERQVCTIKVFGSIWRIVPESLPSKARNLPPVRGSMVTGNPVNAACSAASRYMSKSFSGGAGSDAALTMLRGILKTSNDDEQLVAQLPETPDPTRSLLLPLSKPNQVSTDRQPNSHPDQNDRLR